VESQEGLLFILLALLDEPFDVLVLVEVEAAPVPVVEAEVTLLFEAQKDVYHVLTACKSDAAEQLALPQTWLTPCVPASLKGVSRVSVQKQLSSTVALAGGEHLPWTSKRGPHSAAQVGRVEKGTMAPFGVCAFAIGMEERTEMIATVDGRIVVVDCWSRRWIDDRWDRGRVGLRSSLPLLL